MKRTEGDDLEGAKPPQTPPIFTVWMKRTEGTILIGWPLGIIRQLGRDLAGGAEGLEPSPSRFAAAGKPGCQPVIARRALCQQRFRQLIGGDLACSISVALARDHFQ